MGALVKFQAPLKTTIAAEFWSCPCRWHRCEECQADLSAVSVEEQIRVYQMLGNGGSRVEDNFEAAAYLFRAADLLRELELGEKDRARLAVIRSETARFNRLEAEARATLNALNEERSALLRKVRRPTRR
jgi:hypothetical protein